MKPILALLKLGHRLDQILAMPEEEMLGWIESYNELIQPPGKTKTYKVCKKAAPS